MVYQEITAITQTIKTAIDIVKGISSYSKEHDIKLKSQELQDVIIKLQNEILEMQSKFIDIMKNNEILQAKLDDYEKWEDIQKKYKLIELGNEVYVYSYIKSDDSDIPEHILCAKCFNEKIKSILQLNKKNPRVTEYLCHNCKNFIRLQGKGFKPRTTRPPISNWSVRI